MAEGLATRYGLDSDAPDGWVVAESLSKIGCELGESELKDYAKRLAARAVLRRAHRLVGPIRPALRRVFEPPAEPFRGELDLDRTLENASGRRPEPRDWIMMRREEKQVQLILMMDVSFSMSGRNLALAALAAAVLALKVRENDLAVVAFDSTAKVLSRLGSPVDHETLIGEILGQPARGYTNIEDAMEHGLKEQRRARRPDPATLLITDGIYTAGGDPYPLAGHFARLNVLLTEDYKMNEELCQRMARAGRGEVFRVRHFEDLPSRMLAVANRLLR